jgi:hypothetical protein
MSREGGHSGIVTIVEAIAEEGDKELIKIQMNQPVVSPTGRGLSSTWASASGRRCQSTCNVYPRVLVRG